MKNLIRVIAVLLVSAMLIACLPMAAAAYGADDQRLSITHINGGASNEGAGVIISGSVYSTLGSVASFSWWKALIFDWNEDAGCYKITGVYDNANSSDKSNVAIPSTGFAYCVCKGNNYPELYQSSGNAAFKDKPNYINDPTKNSHDYISKTKTPVGSTAYLYGTDLANGVISTSGGNWYEEGFVSSSYIKIGDPIEGETPYTPGSTPLLQYVITPTSINTVSYAAGSSAIFSGAAHEYTPFSSGKYQWWTALVFDWDAEAECYVLLSKSLTTSNEAIKQPFIPENGFSLVDCGANTSAISNLVIGAQCWLYDINLGSGTFGANPRIIANVPEDGAAYNPNLSGTRLDTPVVDADEKGYINMSEGNATIYWNAVENASGYVIALSSATIDPDGELVVLPKVITGTSYTLPAEYVAAGNSYTFWIYAVGDGCISSLAAKYAVKCVSDAAYNTSLSDKTIVAFGDSLTARTGYVQMLYSYLGTDVINAGVGGNTTNNAVGRIKDDVLSYEPDITIVCFGMNDQAGLLSTGKPNVSLETYRANLINIVTQLQEIGSDVVLVTPNPVCTATGYYTGGGYGLDYGYGFMDDFCNAMREIAIEYNCGLVDINRECDFEDLTEFLIYGDGIHQTAYGHKRFAELISDYLYAAYDGLDASTVTVNCNDSEGNLLYTYSHTGKEGAHVTLATPEIEGYTTAAPDIETTFDGNTYTFVYLEGNVIVGDVNGDGDVTATDYLMLKRAILGTYSIADEHKSSADINGDGETTATDYFMLKRAILGTYTIGG